MKLICLLAIIVLFVESCAKKQAIELAGDYFCNVHESQWNMPSPNNNINYEDTLTVKALYQHLYLLGTEIRVQKVKNGQVFYTQHMNHSLAVQFKEDSLIVVDEFISVQGCYRKTYRGLKK